MSATVVWVENKGENAILVMSDDTRVWTPDKAKADALVGKEIPPDWTIKQGQYGPQALPPRDKKSFGGAPAAFRNSKEGQLVEQERMDARTAVMQATVEGVFIKDTANEIYAWLRQASGAAVATVSEDVGAKSQGKSGEGVSSLVHPSAAPTQSSEGESEVLGEGAKDSSSAAHEHQWVPSPKLKSFDICVLPDCYETKKRLVKV
jgi:hypothetical protein